MANLQEELRQHLAQAARIAARLGAALPSEMAQRQTLAHKLPCAEAAELLPLGPQLFAVNMLTATARCSPPSQAWQCGLTSRVGGVAPVSAQTMLLTAAILEGSLFPPDHVERFLVFEYCASSHSKLPPSRMPGEVDLGTDDAGLARNSKRSGLALWACLLQKFPEI